MVCHCTRPSHAAGFAQAEHDFDAKELTQFEPSHARDLPNMVMMQNLHEAPLLFLLQRRLKDGRIYTWAGDVLISLNPYVRIPELYNLTPFLPKPAERTATAALASEPSAGAEGSGLPASSGTEAVEKREAVPHVYTVARKAYTSLVDAMALPLEAAQTAAAMGVHLDQSVLISGESGAGKTEAAKRVLEYLTAASRAAKQQEEESKSGGGGGGAADPPTVLAALRTPNGKSGFEGSAPASISIEALLREASPVLEALGNAKTIRNDNSSRFGKYVAVQYGPNGGIVGALTETYLLERSRVVEVSAGERNYHIFYQMLTDERIRAKWNLPPPTELTYLSSDGQVRMRGRPPALGARRGARGVRADWAAPPSPLPPPAPFPSPPNPLAPPSHPHAPTDRPRTDRAPTSRAPTAHRLAAHRPRTPAD